MARGTLAEFARQGKDALRLIAAASRQRFIV
jgi:hypothetical protein